MERQPTDVRLISGLVLLFFVSFASMRIKAEEYHLSSPDENLRVIVRVEDEITYAIDQADASLLRPSKIAMTLQDGTVFGRSPKVDQFHRRSVNRTVSPVVPVKYERIRDHFNEVKITFSGPYALIFRAYNEGVAYRFKTTVADPVTVEHETAQFVFPEDASIYVKEEQKFHSNHEVPYTRTRISDISSNGKYSLPALVDRADGPKLLITESDVRDYPNLWYRGHEKTGLKGLFPRYPLEEDRKGNVSRRADFIARTQGTREFPWRVVILAENDVDLLTNELVYLLAKPSQIDDPSWIDPGLTILDWWGRRHIFGVDFEAGVNTETMKYYIDFCARRNIPYYLIDADWTERYDLRNVAPDVDIEEVVEYSHKKQVGLILWVNWKALQNEFKPILDQFEDWGIRGIKVDYMDRDDQKMVNFYHRVARACAKRNMFINFHGSYKPTGLRRTFPNVFTREGFIEFEYNGWSKNANPRHHMILPFTRMVLGPLDYIPATLNNARKSNFCPVGDRPMGQGTRAHSIALAVLFESPIQMIPDSPSDYDRAPRCTRFITGIPVTWDETVGLAGDVGQYAAVARRHGKVWYVAAATNWSARELSLDLSFLGSGAYRCEYIQDGPNSKNRAIDHEHGETRVTRSTEIPLQLAPGGGWVARLSPED